MIRIFFLSQSSPILELFPFDKITLKSYICTVVTVMAKQCWSQTESGSWGHSFLQTPALVEVIIMNLAQNVCLDDFSVTYISLFGDFLKFFHLGQFLSNYWSYRVIFGTCEVFVFRSVFQ